MSATCEVIEFDAGLRVKPARGTPFEVRVAAPDWVLASGDYEFARIALGDLGGLAEVLTRLMRGRRSRLCTVAMPGRPDVVLHQRVVHEYLRERYDTTLARLAPQVRRIAHALQSAGVPLPRLVFSPALLAERWVVEDVLRFRAAAIALAYLDTRLRPELCGDDARQLEALRGWRGLFSPDDRPYRSLNRTLMKLPDGFSAELLCDLRWVRLERPVTSGVELALACVAGERLAQLPDATRRDAFLRIVLHARGEEIALAVARVAAATGRRLSPRRPGDLGVVLGLLLDYPRPHAGRLGGWVDRALRWHRVPLEDRAVLEAVGGIDAPTRTPPIALPVAPGIRFLATAGEVVEEGERMGHCIASYAARAVAGRSYLFHITRHGEQASIEVDARGRVREADGPRNTMNGAVRWGRRILRTWGARFRARDTPFLAGHGAHPLAVDDRQLCLFPGD